MDGLDSTCDHTLPSDYWVHAGSRWFLLTEGPNCGPIQSILEKLFQEQADRATASAFCVSPLHTIRPLGNSDLHGSRALLRVRNTGKSAMTEATCGDGRAAPSPFPRRLMRIPTVAQSADISRSTVYRLVGSGDLEMVRIGAASAITVESFDRWIAGLPRVAVKTAI